MVEGLAHPATAASRAFAHLTRWVEEAGGHVGPLLLEDNPSAGRTLHAAAGIPSGEVVLRIPRRCLLTRDAAFSSLIGQQIAAAGIVPPISDTWLAAYLLQELHAPASRFRPYLDLLPVSYAHIPLLFADGDLSLLRGSFTLERIREKRETLAREYGYLLRLIPALRAFSYEQFVWARLTVITRVFGLTVAGQKTQALVPIADLLNHKWPPEASSGYQDSTDGFVVTTLRAFSPNDEIHGSYGRKCNSRFFLNYGFALPDNDDNEARIAFDTPGGPQVFTVSADYESQSTQKMFTFLRGNAEGPIAEQALRLLVEACEQALRQFDTTIEEDDALLADPATTGNARSCILMRRGEKRVLHALLELARRGDIPKPSMR